VEVGGKSGYQVGATDLIENKALGDYLEVDKDFIAICITIGGEIVGVHKGPWDLEGITQSLKGFFLNAAALGGTEARDDEGGRVLHAFDAKGAFSQ